MRTNYQNLILLLVMATVGEFLAAPLRLVGWLWRHRPRWEQPCSPHWEEWTALTCKHGGPHSLECWKFLRAHSDDTDLQERALAFRAVYNSFIRNQS